MGEQLESIEKYILVILIIVINQSSNQSINQSINYTSCMMITLGHVYPTGPFRRERSRPRAGRWHFAFSCSQIFRPEPDEVFRPDL